MRALVNTTLRCSSCDNIAGTAIEKVILPKQIVFVNLKVNGCIVVPIQNVLLVSEAAWQW